MKARMSPTRKVTRLTIGKASAPASWILVPKDIHSEEETQLMLAITGMALVVFAEYRDLLSRFQIVELDRTKQLGSVGEQRAGKRFGYQGRGATTVVNDA